MIASRPLTRRALLKGAAVGAAGTGLGVTGLAGRSRRGHDPLCRPRGAGPCGSRRSATGSSSDPPSPPGSWTTPTRGSMRARPRCCSPRTTCSGTSSSRGRTRTSTSDPATRSCPSPRSTSSSPSALTWPGTRASATAGPTTTSGASSREDARTLLYGVIRREVSHYAGRMNGWIVANEVTDPEEADRHGFRTNVPWYNTIGPGYIAQSFHLAEAHDPQALRIINEFGFETVNQYGDRAGAPATAFLKAIDRLLDQGVPVQAAGIQGHLLADEFAAEVPRARLPPVPPRDRGPRAQDPHHRARRPRRRLAEEPREARPCRGRRLPPLPRRRAGREGRQGGRRLRADRPLHLARRGPAARGRRPPAPAGLRPRTAAQACLRRDLPLPAPRARRGGRCGSSRKGQPSNPI